MSIYWDSLSLGLANWPIPRSLSSAYNQNRKAIHQFPPPFVLYAKPGTLTGWIRKMWSENVSVTCWAKHANLNLMNYAHIFIFIYVWFHFLQFDNGVVNFGYL